MSGAVAVRPVARALARVAAAAQVQGPRVVTYRWLDAQRNRALAVLAMTNNPDQRRAARARLNWLCRLRQRHQELRPVPLMKRGLEIDKVPRGFRR